MISYGREGYIESLKKKSMDSLINFNKMKGGDYKTIQYVDSGKENFRYDVFRRQAFDEEYTGISKLVREKLNNPNYYNNKLAVMAEKIRDNIEKHD